MTNTFKNLLGNISEQDFFNEYWQKKVLFVKNAFIDAKSLASFEDITPLSLDQTFESRLVYETGGEYPWQAVEGPFSKKDLNFNEAKKTLIIHNLNLYFDKFYSLQQVFKKFPTWLFDDIMCTLSSKHASVGAHVDNYNVFIIQGAGKRLWKIQDDNDLDTTFIEDLDIKLLKSFTANKEFVLEPGDMLYIPPQIAHKGITLEKSLSYSVGFRAFNYNDIIFSYFNFLLENYDNYDYFKPAKSFADNPFEVTKNDLDQFCNILQNEIINKDLIMKWVGQYTTEPRVEVYLEEITEDNDCSTQQQQQGNNENNNKDFLDIDLSGKIYKDTFTRLNFYQNNNCNNAINYSLNINSHQFEVDKKTLLEILDIFDVAPFDPLKIKISTVYTNNTLNILSFLKKQEIIKTIL